MEERVEDYIKRIEIIIETLSDHIEFEDYDEDVLKEASKDKEALENLLKRYKELEEENITITTGRKNGKTIELVMKLREEILKLPECKLYGIKNCKNKIVLLTKEECIPTSVIQKKK